MKKKLLLVDDDRTLSNILRHFFKENGFYVVYAYDGASALTLFEKEVPDVVLLDLDLPVKNGFEVMEEIRQNDYITPIILMTGSWLDETYRIRGYELGAIQFLEKPVSPVVLLAQIHSILNPPVVERILHVGEIVFRLRNQVLMVDEKEIRFREREALILAVLFEKHGRIVSRNKLLTLIWGYDDLRNSKTLDNLIYQLKKKLEEYPELNIHSHYSKGYMLEV